MGFPRFADADDEQNQFGVSSKQVGPVVQKMDGVSRGDMLAAGVNPFTVRTGEPEKDANNKDWVWDMILFGGAAAVAAPITGGLSLPLWAAPIITGSLYGAAKIGQEAVTGREQKTITEEMTGMNLPLPARGALHAGEAVAMEGIGKAIIPGFKALSKPLHAASNHWQPVADIIFENIKIPYGKKLIDYGVPFTKTENLGKRTIREVFEPAVARLRGSANLVEKEAGLALTKGEQNKRLATIASVHLEKELHGMSLIERRTFTAAWNQPKLLKKREEWALKAGKKDEAAMYGNVRNAVDRLSSVIQQSGLDPQYEKLFRRSMIKNMNKYFTSDNPEAVHMLMSPQYKHIAGSAWTKETRKAFNQVIDDPGVSQDFKKVLIDLQTLPASVPREVFAASRTAHTKFLKAQFVDNYGLLSKKELPDYVQSKLNMFKWKDKTGEGFYWVPRDVELQMTDMELMERWANGMGNQLLSMWKSGKTVMRPAYHLRNMVSNAILADWGGLPIYRLDVYRKAIKGMRNNAPSWQRFIHETGGAGTMAKDELGMFEHAFLGAENGLDVAWKLWKTVAKPGVKMQNLEENMFKYAKYLHSIEEKGMSHLEAVFDAQKYLMNYGEASVGAGWLRSGMGAMSAMPFATWYTKVIPLTVETAFRHPLRFGKWLLFGAGLQDVALSNLDIHEGEWEQIKKDMPEWLSKGVTVLMPWRDNKDRLNMFNASFMMPGIGDINELINLFKFTSQGGLEIHNPFVSIVSSLKSQEKSSGAPLYNEWDTGATKMAKTGSYIMDQLMPSVIGDAKRIYGADWSAMHKAIEEDELAPSISQAVMSSLGFKMTPMDPAVQAVKAERYRNRMEGHIKSEIREKLRKSKSAKQTEKILKEYRKRIDELYE